MTAAKLGRRPIIIGVLALVALFALLLFSAPASNRVVTGSTWGFGPDGYSAWYEYMGEKGVSIERWQRPLSELMERESEEQESEEQGKDNSNLGDSSDHTNPKTLLRIFPPESVIETAFLFSNPDVREWVAQGNDLVVLAQYQPATAAPFASSMASEQGAVAIETTRRFEADWQNLRSGKPLLSDEHGSVIWQTAGGTINDNTEEETGEEPEENATEARIPVPGTMTVATTPFLAANAFADEPGNFAFLAALMQQSGGQIYVDEYLHGYKDQDVITEQVAGGNWIGYLTQTPLLIAVVQCGAILLIALLAQNQRLGLKRSVSTPQVNNSEAYMQALAGVLHKANNRDFLVETLTRSERKRLQRSLGLGEAPVSSETLQTSWQQNTGRSIASLKALEGAPPGKAGLKTWLKQLQSLHVLASRAK